MLTQNSIAMVVVAAAVAAGAAAGALAATGGDERGGSTPLAGLSPHRTIASVERDPADGPADPIVEKSPARELAGAQPGLEVETGERIDTPSGKFMTVTSKTFTAESGPIVVRFAGEGYEEDWNADAGFLGKSYAAMKVRVLLNGVPLAPGAVTLLDNGGKIGERSSLRGSRASAAAFDWAGMISTSGPQTVTVEFRNLHTWDSATLLRWTLTILHA